MSSSKNGNHHDDEPIELPLLDEVNELIEKERLLLNLKVLEQKQSAEEWKEKYNVLINKMAKNGDYASIEQAADINNNVINDEENNSKFPIINDKSIIPLLNQNYTIEELILQQGKDINNECPYVLNLSGKKISTSSLLKITKGQGLTSLVNPYMTFKVLNFSKCDLNDDASPMLSQIIKNPALVAIDLSNNELGSEFEGRLIEALQFRKSTPSYILLNGNINISKNGANFHKIISSLTIRTWGISVSLKDFNDSGTDSIDNSKGLRKKSEIEYAKKNFIDTANHPMYALEYLKTLKSHLDPDDIALKELKNKKKKVVVVDKNTITRNDGLTLMSIFGLTNAMLCKESIVNMGKIFKLSIATLTDIDLSFSYMGCYGALMLEEILSHKECQIVTLNISGNAIGDSGAQILSNSLVKNNTLTNLNVRSNNISDSGLMQFINVLKNKNRILTVIDFSGNFISDVAYLKGYELLKNVGSKVIIRRNISNVSLFKPQKDDALNTTDIVYEIPFLVTKLVTSDGDACLYSIDVKNINSHYKNHENHPIFIEWSCKPKKNLLLLDMGEMLPSNIGWEIRLNTPFGESILAKAKLSNTSCLTNQLISSSTWTSCRAVIGKLPIKGTLEIWLISDVESMNESRSLHQGGNAKKTFLSAESIDLKISYFSPHYMPNIGGDLQDWSDNMNIINSLDGCHINSFLSKGHKIMRVLKYHGKTNSCRLTWQSKLTILPGFESNVNYDASNTGYEWSILKFHDNNGRDYKIISSGKCGCSSNDDDNINMVNNILLPWQWSKMKVDLKVLNTNDVIIVTAKPIKSNSIMEIQSNNTHDITKKCAVVMNSCNMYVSETIFNQLHDNNEELIKSGILDNDKAFNIISYGDNEKYHNNIIYAKHNSSSLSLPC